MQRMGPSVAGFKEVHSDLFVVPVLEVSGQMTEQFHSLPKYEDRNFH